VSTETVRRWNAEAAAVAKLPPVGTVRDGWLLAAIHRSTALGVTVGPSCDQCGGRNGDGRIVARWRPAAGGASVIVCTRCSPAHPLAAS